MALAQPEGKGHQAFTLSCSPGNSRVTGDVLALEHQPLLSLKVAERGFGISWGNHDEEM